MLAYSQLSTINGNDNRYRFLFEHMSQGFCIIEKIADPNQATSDFRYISVNPAFEKHTQLFDVVGKTIKELIPEAEKTTLEIYDRVADTGKAESFQAHVRALDLWIDGEVFATDVPGQIAVLFANINAQKKAEIKRASAQKALKIIESRFRSFIEVSSDLIYRMSPDWTAMYILDSKELLENTEQIDENWMERYIPEEDRSSVLAAISQAISEKAIFNLEHRVIKANGETGWVHSRALPIINEHGVILEWRGAARDITLRKQAEQQLLDYNERLETEVSERTAALQASQNQLQSVFDTTLLQISILQAVRNEEGAIDDFEIKLVNQELERETQRKDLVGKLYAKEYPGIRDSGLFDLIVKTIETGEPQQTEYYYPHEGFNKWFSCMFVKMNDGVVASNLDISLRKKAEEERFRNYLLLQQSEEIAGLGSWDYDLLNKKFTWSKGMYRLFNMAEGTQIEPEIYLNYTTKASTATAKRIVEMIRQGGSNFEEALEIKIKGRVKVLHLKATVVNNMQGQPVRVLGVDMDVTDMRRAEEKIRKLEAEQRLEIFKATLRTLEEERHRISESLHNGIGQLLYSIKINLDGISLGLAEDAFKNSKAYTQALLTEAIKETRRLSHELMPTILEDFGLKAAILDACQQFINDVNFKCTIIGFTRRIEKYLELAVYRTVQELMTNVVRHAQATEATVEVTADHEQISIRVSDNGRGMNCEANTRTGIGLAAIRSKIKLLNGNVDIRSDGKTGTFVSIVVPQSGR